MTTWSCGNTEPREVRGTRPGVNVILNFGVDETVLLAEHLPAASTFTLARKSGYAAQSLTANGEPGEGEA